MVDVELCLVDARVEGMLVQLLSVSLVSEKITRSVLTFWPGYAKPQQRRCTSIRECTEVGGRRGCEEESVATDVHRGYEFFEVNVSDEPGSSVIKYSLMNQLDQIRHQASSKCHAINASDSNIGVASFALAIGRAAPTRRPPIVVNAAAGVVTDRLLVANMLMVAVIELRPDTRGIALFPTTMVKAGGGLP
jgi:hypothetical protein